VDALIGMNTSNIKNEYTGWPVKTSATFVPEKNGIKKDKFCNWRNVSINRQKWKAIVV